ncbi:MULTISPECIES: aldo/keto reductase [unclassified Caballeronia]|uniref:aldo/keto reductase n=1 Tax=unclassified Caballeronia TaxID=2646786 RepID=UPI0028624F35|nr:MULTISPECIES: aldo/keto reductase [unclassified Caballeronia]MDR5753799.1 aldo/keto reductase [Caballeronia sp. LZ024]MDR5840178.1 aldo/keto reductase [Caballeronia sp. LZ031]
MEYRQLGRSGLKVSTITLGTMTMGGKGKFASVGDVGLDDARRQIDMCIDAGVNLIDTADVYSGGASEEIVGEALGGKRKGGVLIATKARFPMGDGPNDRGLSRHHLIEACEASLRRLKTDVIDLYQVHEWDGLTPLEETLDALDLLVRQGKIRYVGCSNYAGWHLMKALHVSERERLPRFVSQQIHYTLEAREAEYELVPISLDQGLSILVWSPLAGGLLSGKHRRDTTPEGTRQLAGWTEPPIRDEDRLWSIVDVLVEIAGELNVSAAQVALAWTLGRAAVASVVIGGRNEAQLRDNLGAAELTLSAEQRERLDKVSAPPLLYPYWHQVQTASDRLSAADLSLLRPHLTT